MITRPTDGILHSRLMDVINVIDDKHLIAGMPLDYDSTIERQLFCFAEEAGEVMGAWRRWKMGARRSGYEKDFQMEIADVFITLHILCIRVGYVPDELMSAKLDIIEGRGGR